MSISKLFTSIFAMFAILGTNAFAAPSIRQIGVSTSSATSGAKSSESNVERAATTTAVKPVAKPTATSSTTTSTATSGGDTARLVGVPFVAGKSSHNTKANNSKTSTASASTELNSLREQLESLQNDFVALATQNYVDQQLANVRTEAAQAIVEAKNNMVSQEVLTQTVDNAVRDLASNDTINDAMDAKIANLSSQVETKLSKKIEQPQLTSAISNAVDNLASNDTIVTLKNRVDGHDTELAKAIKKDDTAYLDSYVTAKNLASKSDITTTLGDLTFSVDQDARQVKFSVGNDSTKHKFADIADLGGTPGCSSSVTTEPDSVNRQMKITTTNSCTNEIQTNNIPYGQDAKEVSIEVVDGAIKWKRDGESSHKIVDMADLKGEDAKVPAFKIEGENLMYKADKDSGAEFVTLGKVKGDKGQDAKEISIEVVDGAIKWKREGENAQKLVDMADLKGEDAKVPAFKIEGENLMYKADKDSGAEFVTLGKVKGDNGEGLTAQDREDIEAVKTVGTYFTNGKISQDKVDGLSNALASKLTSSDLAEYAKTNDVMLKGATIDKTQLPSDLLNDYAKTNDVMLKGATIDKTQLPSDLLNDYAKTNDVMLKGATIEKTQLPSDLLNGYAKTDDVMLKGATIEKTQLPSDLKISDLDGSDKLVQRSDKLDAVMGKFDDSGNLSEGFKSDIQTEVSNAIDDKGFVTETNLSETASFQQMYNALNLKGLIRKTESGEIVATDETPGN